MPSTTCTRRSVVPYVYGKADTGGNQRIVQRNQLLSGPPVHVAVLRLKNFVKLETSNLSLDGVPSTYATLAGMPLSMPAKNQPFYE